MTAAGTTKRPALRKRNRKRKRRNISSSSSSSSDSSSSSESENGREPSTIKLPQKRPAVTTPAAASKSKEPASSSSESGAESNSDSDSSSDSDSDLEAPFQKPSSESLPKPASITNDATPQPFRKARVPAPPPVENVPEPTLFDGDKEKEEALRKRFRQFWLGCVADAFADDLNEIRKEPNMTPARLSLLIDSLAAGANVYSSSSGPDGKQVNEMEVVLGE